VLACANLCDPSTFAPGEEELKVGMRKGGMRIPQKSWGNKRSGMDLMNVGL
jgi:hypothetical protein